MQILKGRSDRGGVGLDGRNGRWKGRAHNSKSPGSGSGSGPDLLAGGNLGTQSLPSLPQFPIMVE